MADPSVQVRRVGDDGFFFQAHLVEVDIGGTARRLAPRAAVHLMLQLEQAIGAYGWGCMECGTEMGPWVMKWNSGDPTYMRFDQCDCAVRATERRWLVPDE